MQRKIGLSGLLTVFALGAVAFLMTVSSAEAGGGNFCQRQLNAGEPCTQGNYRNLTFVNAYDGNGGNSVCARVNNSPDPYSGTNGGLCGAPNAFFSITTTCNGTRYGVAGVRNPEGFPQVMYGEFGYC